MKVLIVYFLMGSEGEFRKVKVGPACTVLKHGPVSRTLKVVSASAHPSVEAFN